MLRNPPIKNRLGETDWLLIAACVAMALASAGIVVRYFDAAFPQASIDFRFDRNTSREPAEDFLRRHGAQLEGMKHAVRFDSDHGARLFLERTVGLETTNQLTASGVHVWSWHHRWFTPLVEEELSVDVAPNGEIVAFRHTIPEDRAMPAAAPAPPTAFLQTIGVDVTTLSLVEQSERKLPRRTQKIFTWESVSLRPAGAAYRHVVTMDGNRITSYEQRLRVPDAWMRSYGEMRSKNAAASRIDLIFHSILMIGATIVFIVRLRRHDLPLRFLLGIGVAAILLVGGSAINSIPSQFAWYDTTSSYGAFLGNITLQTVVQSIGTAMLLIVVCGAGEVLYRERLPQQLAMPRVWSLRALRSKRVFHSLILGYALVPLFMAYQVVFYLVSTRYGAWAPADVPYDAIMNSALPWVAVLFAGFFPAFSEEFLARAFAIPFLQKLGRSRILAIVVAAFIWGFGHSAYPNQPFWIRGVEVGLAGIVAGLLMDRFGLLPLLVWHYTIDAVYTATILLGSGNTYYVVTAVAASLLFAMPLLVSIALYLRHRAFVPDDDLLNAAIPLAPAEEVVASAPPAPLPAPRPPSRRLAWVCVAAVVAVALATSFRAPSVDDAIDYRIGADRAREIARNHLAALAPRAASRGFANVTATPSDGFRSWNRESQREDGGAPGGPDQIAATWLFRSGTGIAELTSIFRSKIETGTWTVRFFSPQQKEEAFIEVDPRTARVVGYHRYQEEETPGAQLSQEAAVRLATSAFAWYGLDPAAFELREALSFQQPRRRDWLFHFDEKTPLTSHAPTARRRVTVRVAGAALTQFHKSVRIPDGVYRRLTTQRLVNVLLFVLKIAGLVVLLSLVIAGLVTASRSGSLPWRRPLRWTLVLAVLPIAAFAARTELLVSRYDTDLAWETFQVGLLTSFVREVGLQLGLLFLALAGIEAAMPFASRLLRIESRRRFGASAVLRGVTAVAVIALAAWSFDWANVALPAMATIQPAAPEIVALPLPALVIAMRAVLAALIVSGAVLLYGVGLPRWRAHVTIPAIFFASLDPSATSAEMPLMLTLAAATALAGWLVARYILGDHPLAWPFAVFVGSCTSGAVVLLENHRLDLTVNGVALLLVAFAAAAFLWRSTRDDGHPSLP